MATSSSTSSPVLRLAFYTAAIALALIHVFVTFRGISSTEGMTHAQLARTLAREGVWQTRVIQPYALAQMEKNGRQPNVMAMPETTQAPVQPFVWSLAFRVFSAQSDYKPNAGGSPVYFYDRVIACFGVLWWLLTIYLTHGAARKLFDDKVAAIIAIGLLVCQPAWNLAVSGSSRMLLTAEFALAFRLYVSIALRGTEGRSTGATLFLLGCVCAAMVLTQWLAIWLVIGLFAGVAVFLPAERKKAALVAIPPLAALAGWGWWQSMLCGEAMGGVKALFQSQFAAMPHDLVLRDYSPVLSSIIVDDLLRRLGLNIEEQSGQFYAHCGGVVLAVFFFVALLHRFRRTEAAAARWTVGTVLLCAVLGMGLVGLPQKALDDYSIYTALMPAMGVFGAAMLVILWSRMMSGSTFWARWGGPLIALLICAIPMSVNLPVFLKFGLTLGSKMPPHWPPYVPERIAVMKQYLDEGEYLYSDAPHFIAWYTNIPCVALPVQREDFAVMKTKADERKAALAGFVMTPVSAQCERFSDVFTGNWGEWRDLIVRGPMLAFDKNFQPDESFPYRVFHPLVVLPVGSNEHLSLPMAFYAEKTRQLRLPTELEQTR